MALVVVLQNTSRDLPPVSDYAYRVLIGDGTIAHSKVLTAGTLRGHHRQEGWVSLMRAFLEAVEHSEGAPSVTAAAPPPHPLQDVPLPFDE